MRKLIIGLSIFVLLGTGVFVYGQTWTAHIISKARPTPNELQITVEFRAGTFKVRETITLNRGESLQGFKSRLRQRLNEIAANDALDAQITNGLIDVTPTPSLPPSPPQVPSQLELDFRAWRVLLNRLRIAEELVQLGTIPNTLPGYVALKAKVQNDFQAGFLNLMQ